MKTFLAAAAAVLTATSHAQNIGQIYSAFVPVSDYRDRSELTQLPLPPGDWVVTKTAVRKATGDNNANLRDIYLLQISGNRLLGAIDITIRADDSMIRWNDEPCKLDPVNYKNDYGTRLWTQKCLTVHYSAIFQNNNDTIRTSLSKLAKESVTHDFNAIRISYTRFGDVGRFFTYKYFIFPSNYGLDNPRENVLAASPYHTNLIKNHPEKSNFVSAVSRYAEQIVPSLDDAYMRGSRTPLSAFSYSNSRSAADTTPAPPTASSPPANRAPDARDVDRFERSGYGTGFFVNAKGNIVTNYHVVRGAKQIGILRHDRTVTPARIIATDVANDLAILATDIQDVPYLPLMRSEGVKRGERVFTLGYPNIGLQGRSIKFTDGSISAVSGIQDQPNKFQISVPVQPGNSGGPLIDIDGNVVGIVVAKLNAEAALKTAGSLPENINYAVKSNYLVELLNSSKIEFVFGQPGVAAPRNTSDVAASSEKAVVLIGVQSEGR